MKKEESKYKCDECNRKTHTIYYWKGKALCEECNLETEELMEV